jgi:hypothetical protein
MIAVAVYLLCAAAAGMCAVLLIRGYFRTRTRLLLWGGLCFVGLMVDEALVFLDLVILPQVDLFTWRNLSALAGFAVFVFGLIWETE